ncbi:hypothetical protein JCM31598_27520 [Desulfonatronum parangueonense]
MTIITIRFSIVLAMLLLFSIPSVAAEFSVTSDMTPQEAIQVIESAEAGDVVWIQPGIYQFRVYLQKDGVTIRGSDPENRPVFDYAGRDVPQWPGSNSGRLHNWAWQIQASDVTLENLIIRNARIDSMANRSSAGIFLGPETIYKEPTPVETIPTGITLRNIAIHGCEEGLQGTAEGTIVEWCEIFDNGSETSRNPRHNVYLQGGSAIFRFCKIYDPSHGANFNLRTRDLRIEYSEIGAFSAASHSIQVLTNKAQQTKGESYQQTITLIGNKLSGIRHHQNQMSKFLILMNSNRYQGNRMHANLFYNTFEGAKGNQGSIVQLKYMNGTEKLGAHVYNNIFINNHTPLRLEQDHIVTGPLYDVDIQNNWWEAANSEWQAVMHNNIFGGDPFRASKGQANPALGETPAYEPLEVGRTSVTDLGAYDLGSR